MIGEKEKKFTFTTLFKKVDRFILHSSDNLEAEGQTDRIRIFVASWNVCYKKLYEKHFFKTVECSCHTHKSDGYECSRCKDHFVEPLSEWIRLDYDLYFVTLQESVSPNFFGILSKHLEKCTKPLVRVSIKNDRILGFGEGAVVSRKMTSIAAWVRRDLLESGSVKICSSKPLYLSAYNRSKGVLCLQMSIFDQIVCFMGCHLPSDYMERQKSYLTILEKLSTQFGANERLTFKDIFHHVIWAGDFNFKLGMPLSKAVRNILEGNIQHMVKFDEFYLPTSMLKDQNFTEDKITFDPTYKKREFRKVLDKSKKGWLEKEYYTFDSKWYNSHTERVPSWTDRVLKWSDESMESCLVFEPNSYESVVPKVESPFLFSDHSAVSCGFYLRPIPLGTSLPVKLNTSTLR